MNVVQELPLQFEIFVSLIQQYRTKLLENVPNPDYFKSIFFKFKTFITNSKSTMIYNFCIRRGNNLPLGWRNFFNIGNFRKNTSKYAKLTVEPCVCVNPLSVWNGFL